MESCKHQCCVPLQCLLATASAYCSYAGCTSCAAVVACRERDTKPALQFLLARGTQHALLCREKDAALAALQARLNKSAMTSGPTHSFDLESNHMTANRTMSAAALDSPRPQNTPFGGIPRPSSASSQLPALGGAVTKRPVQRAGSHLDRPSASSSMQAYYRQPALRVRFVPEQLEELTRPQSGASHKQWAAQLKLPPMHQ